MYNFFGIFLGKTGGYPMLKFSIAILNDLQIAKRFSHLVKIETWKFYESKLQLSPFEYPARIL